MSNKNCPTKRAPDAGEPAAISSIFTRLIIFLADGFAVPAPAQVTQAVGHSYQGNNNCQHL
ncbi:MAG: hypothetical protein U0Z26_17520 [Anaerolineales bacterium]